MESLGDFNKDKGPLSQNIKEHLDNLNIKTNDLKGEVLDIGAGDGEFAEFLSRNKDLKVMALDQEKYEDEKFEILEGDARKLPFPNESFDYVVSHASIPNVFIGLYSFDHPETSKSEMEAAVREAFSEIVRVLKNNGEACLAPVYFAENYDSQKILKVAVLNNIENLKKQGHQVEKQFMRTEVNPDNGEKADLYRIMIKKLANPTP